MAGVVDQNPVSSQSGAPPCDGNKDTCQNLKTTNRHEGSDRWKEKRRTQ
ncbi:MAG: hypothetical protein HYS22_00040 [Deltaproteobacteria bacterium]|nr:hypothetical protein [Deltaproteobacteria bacterium]